MLSEFFLSEAPFFLISYWTWCSVNRWGSATEWRQGNVLEWRSAGMKRSRVKNWCPSLPFIDLYRQRHNTRVHEAQFHSPEPSSSSQFHNPNIALPLIFNSEIGKITLSPYISENTFTILIFVFVQIRNCLFQFSTLISWKKKLETVLLHLRMRCHSKNDSELSKMSFIRYTEWK